jgi:hypothetical protein
MLGQAKAIRRRLSSCAPSVEAGLWTSSQPKNRHRDKPMVDNVLARPSAISAREFSIPKSDWLELGPRSHCVQDRPAVSD